MKFCPKCDTRIRNKSEEKILICIKCGHNIINEVSNTITANNSLTLFLIMVISESTLKIMDVEKPIESLPTTNIECPKCYNNLAFWWMLQTRSADEATTQFYRCTKCNHTWRNYS